MALKSNRKRTIRKAFQVQEKTSSPFVQNFDGTELADNDQEQIPELDLSLESDDTINSDTNQNDKNTDGDDDSSDSENEDSKEEKVVKKLGKKPNKVVLENELVKIDGMENRKTRKEKRSSIPNPENSGSSSEDENNTNTKSFFDIRREENFEGEYSLDPKVLYKLGVRKEDLGEQYADETDINAWIKNREGLPQIEADYDSDSSTEMPTNTIGNVPIEWYNEYDHIGYDIDGKKIAKPKADDEMEKFLKNADDPASLIKIRDELNQQDIRLTNEELDIIRKVQQGEFPDAQFDPYEDTVEWFTSKTMETPLTAAPEPKKRFVPSKWEHKMVMRIVRSIRNGNIYKKAEPKSREEESKTRFYDIWSTEPNEKLRNEAAKRIPPPKMKLPDHTESYHPPPEYLFTEEEIKQWEDTPRDDRKLNYIPRDYSSLREVPLYSNLISERFQRSLDLYLAPRMQRTKLNIDPDSLIPKLPDPKDLLPYPTKKSVSYDGHTDLVRSISVDHSGTWLLTGSDDNTVRLYEVLTGYCVKVWKFDDAVSSVAWNPNKEICMFVVAVGEKLHFIIPKLVADPNCLIVSELLVKNGFENKSAQTVVNWDKPTTKESDLEIYITVDHSTPIKQLVWHRKGDYLGVVLPNSNTVLIHQLSKQTTQKPFNKMNGLVQKVCFHPIKPWFLVATQRNIRIYNLMQQNLIKTLMPGAKWISSLDVHPQGDNVIMGSYDKKVCWFDLDLSSMPYKTIRYHQFAVRQVCYSKAYPLFASCSDDGSIMLFHNTVYSDLLQNPLIVPVKILKGHLITNSLGVLDIVFHPTKPWLFSCGSDNNVFLWS
ncbi:hypothetical protein BB559_002848 [Furculomyces boomerangus]|uniref:Ribosome biogenesis protein ERB1 n=1 Tax=Furculomyces boomerangus TaxID=61424 RepID=A0A2T9YRZ4_9FUNG|nr:hypothetical protein BB559_002848 [Furculomyces boomerangus]